jgi:hypothetical protein
LVRKEILSFAARQRTRSVMRRFTLDERGVEEALSALEEWKMRYKVVLIV